MITHVGPPIRCDATQSPVPERRFKLPTASQAFALHASTALSPVTVVRFTGVLQGSPGEHKDHAHPAGAGGWLEEVGWSRKPGGSDGAVPRGAVLWKQYDVCYRDRYPCVPTCTAAQLGLYVFARHAERRFWCVQSRVGRFFSSGHEHLQAQRSWSELQLSQQLLPSEERGRIHVILRCRTALIGVINTLHGRLQHSCFGETFIRKFIPFFAACQISLS